MARKVAQNPELEAAGYRQCEPDHSEGLSTVLHEFDVFAAQTSKRRELLRKIEAQAEGKTAGALAFISTEAATIDSDDIPAIGDALLSIGDVDILNLIIDSPGGDGTVAEKIINLCRSYCSKLRVFIPSKAKSAATIIALGADEIVMGFCSEIGPIDAQIPVLVDGIPHLISAQSFINAKLNLEQQFKDCVMKKEDPRAILQQIASLNPAFIGHCERLMEFGKEVVQSSLERFMFSALPKKERNQRINSVLKKLSAVELFKVHGRMINGHKAKTELGLNVLLLGKEDPMWACVWGYYLRTYVFLSGRLGRPVSKIIETKSSLLMKQPVLQMISQ